MDRADKLGIKSFACGSIGRTHPSDRPKYMAFASWSLGFSFVFMKHVLQRQYGDRTMLCGGISCAVCCKNQSRLKHVRTALRSTVGTPVNYSVPHQPSPPLKCCNSPAEHVAVSSAQLASFFGGMSGFFHSNEFSCEIGRVALRGTSSPPHPPPLNAFAAMIAVLNVPIT